MKAWPLDRLGGGLHLKDVPTPDPRPASVLVRIEASSLMSYLKPHVQGKLPMYNPPPSEFTPPACVSAGRLAGSYGSRGNSGQPRMHRGNARREEEIKMPLKTMLKNQNQHLRESVNCGTGIPACVGFDFAPGRSSVCRCKRMGSV
jgi:hypothetical protein